MSRWFVDANVLVAADDEADPQHAHARGLLTGALAVSTIDLAHYEVANVAVRSWRDLEAAARLRRMVDAIDRAGGLVRMDAGLAAEAVMVADRNRISMYDASYVAAARRSGDVLVSCDLRDLVRPGHAVTPEQALAG